MLGKDIKNTSRHRIISYDRQDNAAAFCFALMGFITYIAASTLRGGKGSHLQYVVISMNNNGWPRLPGPNVQAPRSGFIATTNLVKFTAKVQQTLRTTHSLPKVHNVPSYSDRGSSSMVQGLGLPRPATSPSAHSPTYPHISHYRPRLPT